MERFFKPLREREAVTRRMHYNPMNEWMKKKQEGEDKWEGLGRMSNREEIGKRRDIRIQESVSVLRQTEREREESGLKGVRSWAGPTLHIMKRDPGVVSELSKSGSPWHLQGPLD